MSQLIHLMIAPYKILHMVVQGNTISLDADYEIH